MDDQEFATSVLYRLAYGIAADRVEASRFDTLYGRRHQAMGGAAEGRGETTPGPEPVPTMSG